MESLDPALKKMRAILPLGKFRIVKREASTFTIALGGSTTMTVDIRHPHLYDIKDGDLLTLYTEVLLAQPS